MRFLWPELLLLLLLAPLAVVMYLRLLRRKKRSALRYSSLALVRAALGPGQGIRRHVPPALFLASLLAALLAAARPSAVVMLPTDHTTLILSMDVSRSMTAVDVDPNRITAAQLAVKAFFADLPKNVRVGITTFAGTSAVVQTPTRNRDELVAAVDRFELQRGTATGSGLLVSLALLRPDAGIDLEAAVFSPEFFGGAAGMPLGKSREAKTKPERDPVAPGSYTSGAIVLMSDGRRTMGPDPIAAAKRAADLGVRVYTIGFGSAAGGQMPGWPGGGSFYTRLDEETLKAVAKITAAEYVHAGTAADLKRVYAELSSKLGLEKKETEVSAIFSAVAALFAVLAASLSLVWFRGT
jgi:Ca-activated chloride channel family protein